MHWCINIDINIRFYSFWVRWSLFFIFAYNNSNLIPHPSQKQTQAIGQIVILPSVSALYDFAIDPFLSTFRRRLKTHLNECIVSYMILPSAHPNTFRRRLKTHLNDWIVLYCIWFRHRCIGQLNLNIDISIALYDLAIGPSLYRRLGSGPTYDLILSEDRSCLKPGLNEWSFEIHNTKNYVIIYTEI